MGGFIDEIGLRVVVILDHYSPVSLAHEIRNEEKRKEPRSALKVVQGGFPSLRFCQIFRYPTAKSLPLHLLPIAFGKEA